MTYTYILLAILWNPAGPDDTYVIEDDLTRDECLASLDSAPLSVVDNHGKTVDLTFAEFQCVNED